MPIVHSRLIRFICFGLILFCSHIKSAAQPFPDDFLKAPSLRWGFQTGGPIYSSPVIDKETVYFGSLDSTLYALNSTNGQLKWKFKTGGDIRSTILLDDKSLYCISGDGCLYAIGKKNQQLRWKFKGRGDRKYELFSFADYFQSSPVAEGNTIFFGSGDGYVYAVDKTTGTLIWEYQTGSVVHSSPAIHHGKVYVGSFDGYLYALNAKDGHLEWRYKSMGHQYFPKGEMQGSPVIHENLVFVGSRDYQLYALNTETGKEVWKKKFPKGWAMAKPVIRDGVLYVGTSDDKVLAALNPRTGEPIWQADVKFNVFGATAFSENLAYVGTLMGRLYAIDLKSGKVMWEINNPLYEKNRLNYFKEDDTYRNDIQTIIKKNDDFLTLYYNLGAIFSTPVVTQKYIIVTSTDAKIYGYVRK
jgi:outer membrane protein assembly factor BamB